MTRVCKSFLPCGQYIQILQPLNTEFTPSGSKKKRGAQGVICTGKWQWSFISSLHYVWPAAESGGIKQYQLQ